MDIERMKSEIPVVAEIAAAKEVAWINPGKTSFKKAAQKMPLSRRIWKTLPQD